MCWVGWALANQHVSLLNKNVAQYFNQLIISNTEMRFIKHEAELHFINSLRQVHALIHRPTQIRAITKYNNLLPPLWLCLCSIQTKLP